jgi:hypothetical protein
MYGHVDYLLIYGQFSQPTEVFVETRLFNNHQELADLLDPENLELIRVIYGADEIQVAQVFANEESLIYTEGA